MNEVHTFFKMYTPIHRESQLLISCVSIQVTVRSIRYLNTLILKILRGIDYYNQWEGIPQENELQQCLEQLIHE